MTLPREVPPFRVLYVYLKERAVDLFLDPPRHEVWDAALQNGSFTVRNDVFTALQSLAQKFSSPARHSMFYVYDQKRDEPARATEPLANDPPDRPAFAGSSGENNGNGFDQHVDIRVAEADLHALLTDHGTWGVLQRPMTTSNDKVALPETTLLFRRNCERSDLSTFGNQSLLARFYAYVAGDDVPPDFAWVDLSIDYSACGEEEAPYLTLTGRRMLLEIAVLENTTAESIDIGSFGYQQSRTTALRHADGPSAEHPQRAVWFAPISLKPGERILIPTRLLLEFAPEQPWLHTDRSFPRVADVHSLTPEMLARFGVTPADIAPLLANTPPSLTESYMWGPAIALRDVQIEGLTYGIRTAGSRNTLVLSGNEIGSCPYFSGYSVKTGWRSGGTILRGRSSRARAGTERRALPAFDGRVLLEEREREETFITRLAVEVTTEDDGVYLIPAAHLMPLHLQYQDRVEINFRPMPPKRIKKAALVATGYFTKQ